MLSFLISIIVLAISLLIISKIPPIGVEIDNPIKALLASSFSKKGISEAATDTSCFGDTSIISI